MVKNFLSIIGFLVVVGFTYCVGFAHGVTYFAKQIDEYQEITVFRKIYKCKLIKR